MDKISLKGMAFYARHGVLDEERKIGQRFLIDIDLYLDLAAAGETDRLEDTVNYGEVYEKVRHVTEGNTYALIEKLAGEINRELLESYPQLEQVETTIHKPGAPVSGIFADISVTLENHRKYE